MTESLYNMTMAKRALLEGCIVYDEETGEVIFDTCDFEKLEADQAKKAELVYMFGASEDALAESIEKEAKKMLERAKTHRKKAEAMRKYIKWAVETGGEIETEHFSAKLRKCPAHVEILDETAVPFDYFKEKTTRTIDKTMIKNDLKAGYDVPGCALVSDKRLEIK